MTSLGNSASKIAIGQRLRELRQRRRQTQAEFSAHLLVSPRAYVNYERGEREMPTAVFKEKFFGRGIKHWHCLRTPVGRGEFAT